MHFRRKHLFNLLRSHGRPSVPTSLIGGVPFLPISLGAFRSYLSHWGRSVPTSLIGGVPFLPISLGAFRYYLSHWGHSVPTYLIGGIPFLPFSLGAFRSYLSHWGRSVLTFLIGGVPFLPFSLGAFRSYLSHWGRSVLTFLIGGIPFLPFSLGAFRSYLSHWGRSVLYLQQQFHYLSLLLFLGRQQFLIHLHLVANTRTSSHAAQLMLTMFKESRDQHSQISTLINSSYKLPQILTMRVAVDEPYSQYLIVIQYLTNNLSKYCMSSVVLLHSILPTTCQSTACLV